MLRVARYGKSRYWALWDGNELVAVVLYKKGAAELLRRLEALPLAGAEAAAQAAAVEAAARQAQALAEQARALARQARALVQAARACSASRPARRERRAADAARPAWPRHRCRAGTLVARSWRATTPGQREAPTPTTSPGHARQPRAARLSWTAPQWRPFTSPPTPTREGLRRPGLLGAEPLTLFSNGWQPGRAGAGSPASCLGRSAGRADAQAIAALTAS